MFFQTKNTQKRRTQQTKYLFCFFIIAVEPIVHLHTILLEKCRRMTQALVFILFYFFLYPLIMSIDIFTFDSPQFFQCFSFARSLRNRSSLQYNKIKRYDFKTDSQIQQTQILSLKPIFNDSGNKKYSEKEIYRFFVCFWFGWLHSSRIRIFFLPKSRTKW